MPLKKILAEARERMDKSVEYYTTELRGIRTGRATTALIDYIKIDYYGSSTDLRELAATSVPEPTKLLVKPFDPSIKSEVVRALETADLGLNPMVDGNSIYVSVPPPSSERRKQLVAQVRKLAEETRIAVRNERRDAMKQIDRAVADKENHLSEDMGKDAQSEIEELTKKHVAHIDEVCARKSSEVEES